jgi:hypothetical protein
MFKLLLYLVGCVYGVLKMRYGMKDILVIFSLTYTSTLKNK